MNRHLKMYLRWLNEVEDFRLDVTHLRCVHNPMKRNGTLYCDALTGSSATAPRSLRCFTYSDGQAELTADFYAENQPCHCVPSSVKAFGAA